MARLIATSPRRRSQYDLCACGSSKAKPASACRACWAERDRANRRSPERFWAHVDKSGDCWLWTGARRPKGYGMARFRGRFMSATWAVWELATGQDVPPGLQVCHHCDNPPCVRPDHLFLGTNRDNAMDSLAKGRHRYIQHVGAANGNAKLTEDQVREIRDRAARGEGSTSIARRFGVSDSNVWSITTRRHWKQVA